MGKIKDTQDCIYRLLKERGPMRREEIRPLVEKELGEFQSLNPGNIISSYMGLDARFRAVPIKVQGTGPDRPQQSKRYIWELDPNFREGVAVPEGREGSHSEPQRNPNPRRRG